MTNNNFVLVKCFVVRNLRLLYCVWTAPVSVDVESSERSVKSNYCLSPNIPYCRSTVSHASCISLQWHNGNEEEMCRLIGLMSKFTAIIEQSAPIKSVGHGFTILMSWMSSFLTVKCRKVTISPLPFPTILDFKKLGSFSEIFKVIHLKCCHIFIWKTDKHCHEFYTIHAVGLCSKLLIIITFVGTTSNRIWFTLII